jgi:chitinase
MLLSAMMSIYYKKGVYFMKRIKKIIGVLLSLALLVTMIPAGTGAVKAATGKNIIVYFPNWGIYNSAHRTMTVGMIPWNKVTVINHAFFEVDSSFKLASIDTFADFDKMMDHSEGWDANQLRGHFGEYKYYKNLYPNVKIILSIGGWTRGQNFHAMAATASNRAVFIQSVIDFLKKYPFIDGVDLDWEYPGINRAADPNDQYDRGCPGGPEDKQNFTSLLREIRQAYNNNGLSNKLLTIAAPSGYDKLELQEPDVYAQYLDWLNVMTYDMHGAWENTTNHQSPLYANPNDPSGTSPVDIKNRYNTDSAMKTLQNVYKIPAEKLLVGSPYYSRGWKGVTGGVNGMYAAATGAATGSWDNPQSPGGQYPYFTLKTMENQGGYVKYRDDTYAKTPWLYNASQGIVLSYEDPASLTARCDYINSNGYGGLIVWEISGDTTDFELTTLAYQKLIGNTQTVATPVFNPAAGTYTSTQTVSISCATAGAEIRYTVDGSEPAASSALYASALTVSATTTVKAKAFKTGMSNSSTVTAVYTINPNPILTVADPVFSPAEGTYTSAQTVAINCATAGAEIRYTLNGTEPTASSALYSAPLTVSATTTIKAKAFKSGYTSSATISKTYTIKDSNQPAAWAPGTAYKTGDLVTYEGKTYKCVQGHTALAGWTPAAVPALWSLVQ